MWIGSQGVRGFDSERFIERIRGWRRDICHVENVSPS